MSPIPSVTTGFALSTAAPSVALDPGSARQSASVLSRHLLGTGGFVFAVVALVSVASYFYHGRGAANNTRNTWISLTGLLSSMRRRGPTTTFPGPATDWPVDVEVGFEQHVNMVYAKFFHPTFWNVVECHLGTPSAPAIYVEDEAIEIPATEPKLPGTNSFLNMDDDDGNGDNGTKLARERQDRRALPPYDTSSSTDVNFNSQIIGATVRPGPFLSVPEELEAPTECSSSDTEVGSPCSPHDGMVTTDDFACSPYDGIVTMEPSQSSGTRRYGVADMAHFAHSLKDTVPELGYNLVPTISRRTGLLDLSNFIETDPIPSCGPMERLGPADEEWTLPNCNVGVHDSHNGMGVSPGDVDTFATPHEGPDLMRRLLAELRDPDLDCSPRPLSEDSDFEYSRGNDEEGDEEGVPCLICPGTPRNMGRHSLGSISAPETDSDASDEGLIYPFTPPSTSATSLASIFDVHRVDVLLPFGDMFSEKVLVMSPTSPDSLLSLPTKAHVRSRRDSRSSLHGLRVPLAKLPRL